jgi:hypothetical protein
MRTRLVLVLGAILAGLLALMALQPGAFRVERSTAIEAPAEVVFARVQNLRAMNEWSPFARMDPEMVIRYAGRRPAWALPPRGKARGWARAA